MTVQAKTTSLPATMFCPEFLFLSHDELRILFNVLRDPLATQAYQLMLMHSNFQTGEFLGGYHRLMELCTPPQPQAGKRRPGPSLQQLRRVVGDLIAEGLVSRDAAANAAQGQLRLQLRPRDQKAASSELHNRDYNRVAKGPKPVSTRVPKASSTEMKQGIQQGYQEGSNTPISPQPPSYPQTATPARESGIAALKALQGNINRPPQGVQKAPQGVRGGRVAASRLTPGPAGEGSTMKQPFISIGGVLDSLGSAAG